jgi:hypothetical protein
MPSPFPTVFGIFRNESQAAVCVELALGSGFEHEDVLLLLPETFGKTYLPIDGISIESDRAVIEAFEAIGIPRRIAPEYANHVKEGGLLLTVRCTTSLRGDRAEMLLAESGAEYVTTSSGLSVRGAATA